jgi:hypothetical protein
MADEAYERPPDGPFWRSDYVPKGAAEAEYIAFDPGTGHPRVKLRQVRDRLALCPVGTTGIYLNPKSPAIRRLGLITAYVRGREYQGGLRKTELRPGDRVSLLPEPTNPYDGNAVAVLRAGSRKKLGYVQRGRAPMVAKRLGEGEQLRGVAMRDGFILIAEASVLQHLIS